jgi:hypothetical protein
MELLEQGFGMSYTSFACKDLTLPHEISSGERLGLGVEIRNTGKRDGRMSSKCMSPVRAPRVSHRNSSKVLPKLQ